MRLNACECRAEHYRRVRRSKWMRALFPARRLYHCLGCNEILFIRPVPTERNPFRDTAPQMQLVQEQGVDASPAWRPASLP